MNLAIRGILGEKVIVGDTLLEHKFHDLKADFMITNPPFNMTKWRADKVETTLEIWSSR